MNRQRFREIEWSTDDLFYEDAETGLLMVLSCELPKAERQAELARRSEKLLERLAIKIANRVGRPPTKGEDWKLADEVEALKQAGKKHRAAVGEVARALMRRTGIGTEKAARARVNAAIRERQANPR